MKPMLWRLNRRAFLRAGGLATAGAALSPLLGNVAFAAGDSQPNILLILGDGKPVDKSNFPYIIEYLDKQVSELVKKLDELGLRDNTLILFSGDNGTDRLSTEMADGRVVHGGKGTLKDTGSHVPLLANWPGTVPADHVYDGLMDFTDIVPTCLELAGAKAPAGMDGISFAQQLRGQPGKPREWVHAHLDQSYFVRDANFKLRENGDLFDMADAPFKEKLIPPDQDTLASKAARQRLHP